jgi:hypothetical protein
MKKIMFYLVLLSLMAACRKSSCVDCSSPSESAAIAQELILGKWQLERTIFISRLLGKRIYKTKKDFPNYILIFQDKGIIKLFRNDTLIGGSTFKFIKEKEIAPTSNSNRDLLFMNNLELPSQFEGVTPFGICNDSLYLSFQSYASDITPDQVWLRQ